MTEHELYEDVEALRVRLHGLASSGGGEATRLRLQTLDADLLALRLRLRRRRSQRPPCLGRAPQGKIVEGG